MARRLITTHDVTCDWHAALHSPQEVEAVTQRTAGPDKTIDLCGFCALIWDFCGPRMDEIKKMIRPEVLETLLRSARPLKPEDEETAGPLQLAMTEEGPAEHVAPASAKKTAGRKNGQWIDGVEQVICPLPHRAGSPDTYWVKLRDRGSHAKSSHHKLGPEIGYKLPDPSSPNAFTLPVKCFEHEACAQAGGYGFKDESGLKFHSAKASAAGWPVASPEAKENAMAANKDAAATREQPAA